VQHGKMINAQDSVKARVPVHVKVMQMQTSLLDFQPDMFETDRQSSLSEWIDETN
jgi:hypothetical protein